MEEKKIAEGEGFKSVKILIPFASISLIFGIQLSCIVGPKSGFLAMCVIVTAIFIFVISMFLYFYLSRCSITVTNKRVYGTASFGKRVDLPLDAISAVGTSALWGIDVGTSSGRIHFKLIKNKDEIHSAMSKLLVERQPKEIKNTVVENIISTSNADELKKFKELLDSGVITQEEFDEKKKQLLGL